MHTSIHSSIAGLILFTPICTLLAASSPTSEDPALAGSWTWTWKDAEGTKHTHRLEVEGANNRLIGREVFDNEPAIKVDELRRDASKVRCVVTRDGRRAVYEGKFASPNTINGLVTVTIDGQATEYGWTATREAEKNFTD
jgi:hypothetical protein